MGRVMGMLGGVKRNPYVDVTLALFIEPNFTNIMGLSCCHIWREHAAHEHDEAHYL